MVGRSSEQPPVSCLGFLLPSWHARKLYSAFLACASGPSRSLNLPSKALAGSFGVVGRPLLERTRSRVAAALPLGPPAGPSLLPLGLILLPLRPYSQLRAYSLPLRRPPSSERTLPAPASSQFRPYSSPSGRTPHAGTYSSCSGRNLLLGRRPYVRTARSFERPQSHERAALLPNGDNPPDLAVLLPRGRTLRERS